MRDDVLFLAKLREFTDYAVKNGTLKYHTPAELEDVDNTEVTATLDVLEPIISEEWHEFWDAVNNGEPKENVTKELGDLLYTLIQFAVVFDLPIVEAMNRICKNNIQKWETGTINEAGKLVKHLDHPKVNLKDLF